MSALALTSARRFLGASCATLRTPRAAAALSCVRAAVAASPASLGAISAFPARWHSSAAAYFNEAVGIDNEEADFIKLQGEEKVKFRLSSRFVEKYKDRRPPFGFNGLGEVVFHRSYARPLPDGTKEQWYQTVERVVNGTYNMQKQWIEHHQLGWNPWTAQKSAQVPPDTIEFSRAFAPCRYVLGVVLLCWAADGL